MKQYKRHLFTDTVDGHVHTMGYVSGNVSIPEDVSNTDYITMMQEVEAGLAEIVEQDDTPVPTVDDIRREAYGPIGDQLDEIYWDQVNGTTTWVDHIAAVKAANPKAI